MDLSAISTSYARWARVYDQSFGALTHPGRRRAVEWINARGGRVLEVGVGTGLSLPFYGPETRVTGIDFSQEMLARARDRVRRDRLTSVEGLERMDARALAFPDASFDVVTAMHVMSVVPEPERVMAEIARVCRPGGHVVITNHFKTETGPLAWAERRTASLADHLGWHSDFEIARVTATPGLELIESRPLPPMRMMTFLAFRRV
ncbi:methyltransferase domain-containing protein [Frigidibacter sp. MR17.14]|uniref:class I SAM-dependent methyltransferase n=1 Tax=Frigidibacter sp. MR17.14 TaxID=3126509 RepID=UPI003012CA3B